jgi:glutaredoxin
MERRSSPPGNPGFLTSPAATLKPHTDPMEITVYSAPWCPDCREAKRFLEQHQLPYTDINIETTPGAAAEVIKRTGKRAIPQFVIDGEWVQPYRPDEGFLYEEMAKRLGLE